MTLTEPLRKGRLLWERESMLALFCVIGIFIMPYYLGEYCLRKLAQGFGQWYRPPKSGPQS